MPFFEVYVETTHVLRGRVMVEAPNAEAAVAYANANHDWANDGDPDEDAFLQTRRAIGANTFDGAGPLPKGYTYESLPWNGRDNRTIHDILRHNAGGKP